MILLALLLQLADSLTPKPAPPRAAWRTLIGAYADGPEPLYVYEDRGGLVMLVDSMVPALLAQRSESVFSSPAEGPLGGDALVFRRSEIQAGRRAWRRLQLGPADGRQLRLQPVQPVAELLRVDRTLTPPAESGAFLAPDLVEPAAFDASIHLDIRYASTNNFLGSVFYSSPRAFLQRAATLAPRVAASRARGARLHREPERVVAFRLPRLGSVPDSQRAVRGAATRRRTPGQHALHPRRHPARLQRPRTRVVGRAVPRPAHPRESTGLEHQRLERHHLSRAAARARAADRP